MKYSFGIRRKFFCHANIFFSSTKKRQENNFRPNAIQNLPSWQFIAQSGNTEVCNSNRVEKPVFQAFVFRKRHNQTIITQKEKKKSKKCTAQRVAKTDLKNKRTENYSERQIYMQENDYAII